MHKFCSLYNYFDDVLKKKKTYIEGMRPDYWVMELKYYFRFAGFYYYNKNLYVDSHRSFSIFMNYEPCDIM